MTRPIDDLLAIMARLRDPENGCPWDVKQDFSTIAPYTIEEAYEVADAIDRKDWNAGWANLEEAFRENPSSRIAALFAVVCRGKGDEVGARNWLVQAAVAPREADWSDLDPEGSASP